MSESDLIRSIMQSLAWYDHLHALRLNAGLTIVTGQDGRRRAIRGVEAGTPDILVMVQGGGVVWLEAKTRTGRLSKPQKAWHARAASMGHTVHVVRSVDDALDALGVVR